MSQRVRSSKRAPSAQRIRSSQGSKPRHVPDVAGLFPFGTTYSTEQDSSCTERNYALSSVRPQYGSHGHVQDSPWTHTGYPHPPNGDASVFYSSAHGDCPPTYDATMAESGQNPPSYTTSAESSIICPSACPWPSGYADTSIYTSLVEPTESEFEMNCESAIFADLSGSEYFGLPHQVSCLPVNQSSEPMHSAPNFLSNGPCFYGNMHGGVSSITNNIHIHQRVAAESHLQAWTHTQQTTGLATHMPLTPPASDHGTPPNTQECPSLSPQDSGHDAYDQYGYQLPQEGTQISHTTYAATGVTSQHQSHGTTIKKSVLTQRPIRSASDRQGSLDSQDPHACQPEGNQSSDAQPRSHHLYQAAKCEDGLWRCPFRETTKCTHEPTQQKCGYDKYLDSHIKPFVCTFQECDSPNFSSNACLFRHQREAHGLHGHGENPHLCHYTGCDRSRLANGFPRKWNLKDHMKRVHGWEESDDCASSGSPPALSHKPGQTGRKRKGSPPAASVAMKRQSSSQAKARAASVSHYQYSQQLDQAGNQNYAAKEVWPCEMDNGFPCQENFYAIPHAQYLQTDGYPQHFGQSQEYYAHEAKDLC